MKPRDILSIASLCFAAIFQLALPVPTSAECRFEDLFAPALAFPTISNPTCVAAADLDNDGQDDLAVGAPSSTTLLLNATAGDVHFALPMTVNMGANVSLAAGDFNGDGIADLIAANSAVNSSVYMSVGTGNTPGMGALFANTGG